MSHELENHLRSNLDALDRKKPDPAVLGRVLEEMKAKSSARPGGIVIPFGLLKWAAACLLAAACGIAWWHFNKQQPAPEIVKTNIPGKQPLQQPVADSVQPTVIDIVDEDIAVRKNALVRKVRPKQVVVFAGLNNMQSAAGRINAVASASRRNNNGNDVVDALVKILDNDPNASVRLAALDGLARFYREGYVRKKLVASLKKQQDPVVQINLIALLTRMRESGILSELEKMVNNENTNKTVKDFAYSGILQLRGQIIN